MHNKFCAVLILKKKIHNFKGSGFSLLKLTGASGKKLGHL